MRTQLSPFPMEENMKRRTFVLYTLAMIPVLPGIAHAKNGRAPFRNARISKTDAEHTKWLGWWEGPWERIRRDGGLFVHRVWKENNKYKADVTYWRSNKYDSGDKNTKTTRHVAVINNKNTKLSFNGLVYKLKSESVLRVTYKGTDRGRLEKIV